MSNKAESSKKEGAPQAIVLDHMSAATRLLEKRRQMFEVQEALAAQKEGFTRREDVFRRREEALRKKDLDLQDSLIKFNKFLQENESKRNRAVKRATDEYKQRIQKEGEIIRLREELEVCTNQSAEVEKSVEKNKKYTRYLEMVHDALPEDYPEIIDLLNRFRTLKDANEDLLRTQQKHEQENETKRLEFSNFSKEKGNEVLNHNNEIAALKKQLETLENRTVKLQHDIDISIRGSSDKSLELGQIIVAVENLLLRCTSGMHGEILKHTETAKDDEDGMGPGGGAAGRELDKVDKETMSWRGEQAKEDLDVIAAYMMDFQAIESKKSEIKALAKSKLPSSPAPTEGATGAGERLKGNASVGRSSGEGASNSGSRVFLSSSRVL